MPFKFSISFGLVNIPVKIHHAVKGESVSFNMLSPKGNRVRLRLVDEVTGEEVERSQVKKGYEVSKGQYVVIEPEELKALKLKTTKTIELVGFVPASLLGSQEFSLLLKESFYVEPEKAGAKGFAILHHALSKLGVMAVGKAVLSGAGKESIVVLSAWRNLLILFVLYYPHEVQRPPQVELVSASDKEKALGEQLLQTLGQADLREVKNKYMEAVKQLIQAKLEGKPIEVSQEVQETKEEDLAAALEKSLGLAKKKLGVAVSAQGSEEVVEV
jgi:DNA end-binding protein Ku